MCFDWFIIWLIIFGSSELEPEKEPLANYLTVFPIHKLPSMEPHTHFETVDYLDFDLLKHNISQDINMIDAKIRSDLIHLLTDMQNTKDYDFNLYNAVVVFSGMGQVLQVKLNNNCTKYIQIDLRDYNRRIRT